LASLVPRSLCVEINSLRGVWATLLLPLNADDSIDVGRLETQAATLATSELDGLYAHGTAGEFQTLTEAEFDQINEVLAGAGKPFQIGASHPSAQVQLDRVRRAAAREPGAIQVILPDWLPLNDGEVLAFLHRSRRPPARCPWCSTTHRMRRRRSVRIC